MKSISTVINQRTPVQVVSASQAELNQQQSVAPLSHAASMLVNKLFSELQAVFPAWRHTFPSEETLAQAKKTWVKGFVDAGISQLEQIRLGVKRARLSKSPHWPSVGMFIEWCKPTSEDFGLPCKEDAFKEAMANLGCYITANWSHPAVQVAVRNTTTYVLRHKSDKVARTEFYRNYGLLIQRVINGESLNVELPKAIPVKAEYRPADSAIEQMHLANMKRMVGLL